MPNNAPQRLAVEPIDRVGSCASQYARVPVLLRYVALRALPRAAPVVSRHALKGKHMIEQKSIITKALKQQSKSSPVKASI